MDRAEKIYLAMGVFIALLLKIFYSIFYTVANDDNLYMILAENIFKIHKISINGVQNLVELPPGYPVFLGLEKLIFLKYDNAFFFNFVVLTTLTSFLLIIFYRRNFSRKGSLIFMPIAFLYPIFITSNKMLSMSSEYIYTFLLWLGIFFLYEYLFFSPKKIYLFLISTLFSVIYLIRPEGLLFLFLSLMAILFFKCKALGYKDILVFALPAFIFILPYMYFLFKTLGYLTISGKIEYIGNLTNFRHVNKLSLSLYNFKKFLLLFLSPNFINPLVSVCLFCYLLIFKFFDEESRKRALLLLVFFFSMIAVLIRFVVWARAVYPVLPVFLIVCSLCINYALNKYRLKPYPVVILLSLYLVFCSFLPMLKDDFYNHPWLYKKAGIFIKNNFGSNKVIMSRGYTSYYAEGRGLEFADKNIIPEFIVISNLTHVSLPAQDMLESDNLFQKSLLFKGKKYLELQRYGKKRYFVKIFRKEGNS